MHIGLIGYLQICFAGVYVRQSDEFETDSG